MHYLSCRGPSRTYSFEEAVFAGWAEDGGMLMPAHLPRISREALQSWAGLSYPELCIAVLQRFIPADEVPPDVLQRIILEEAFERFGIPEIVRLQQVQADDARGASREVTVCELWHGPTLAFKDLGMQILGRLLQYFLDRRGGRLNVLVGTSGDTGSSAIEAVRGLDGVTITCLYPKGRIARLQELQMTIAGEEAPHVHVIGVEGTSDDLDVPIQALFNDIPFRKAHHLGSLNSVNIVRLLVQMVHYFYAYLQRCPEADQDITFYIPSGAGGHAAAGVMARMMGLPMAKLHVVVNHNDILRQIIEQGTGRTEAGVQVTVAPSMDIQVPYNLERLLYLADGGKTTRTAQLMDQFRAAGTLTVPPDLHRAFHTTLGLTSSAVSDAEVLGTIRGTWSASGYALDPHTATGVYAALQEGAFGQLDTAAHVVCMGCAHPAKFMPVVAQVLGSAAEWLHDTDHPNVAALLSLADHEPVSKTYPRGTDWEARLRQHIASLL